MYVSAVDSFCVGKDLINSEQNHTLSFLKSKVTFLMNHQLLCWAPVGYFLVSGTGKINITPKFRKSSDSTIKGYPSYPIPKLRRELGWWLHSHKQTFHLVNFSPSGLGFRALTFSCWIYKTSVSCAGPTPQQMSSTAFWGTLWCFHRVEML